MQLHKALPSKSNYNVVGDSLLVNAYIVKVFPCLDFFLGGRREEGRGEGKYFFPVLRIETLCKLEEKKTY